MKRLILAPAIVAGVLSLSAGNVLAASDSGVPKILKLGKPLHARHLTRKQALGAAGTMIPLQGHTYSVLFGSWVYQGLPRGTMRTGKKVDVWEVRINNVVSYSYCVAPGTGKRQACNYKYHYAVIVDDATAQVLQTTTY